MRCTLLITLAIALPLHADDLGLKAPPKFRITQWADHTLANDIYTMALDEKGRVVVSGPGYIRRLEDTNGDGKADKATEIAPTKTGAMGLLFARDQNTRTYYLFANADGQVAVHLDPETKTAMPNYWILLKQSPFSEHGGHALKIGPDGEVYAAAGNNAKIDAWQQIARTSIPRPEGGGILKLSDWAKSSGEVIAHGFRNPYDFDFTPYGDIITFDSDTERDAGLPWYTPTRVYHVMPGMHHGWRLPGGMRSFAKRDYYPDTVPMLADMGRGSPTGVCCYRHYQFPEHYRGGVFLLDWTFGKVYYMPLIPEGSSYRRVRPEVFIESTGGYGFAPTAARVAPDGSLFISIGGRGTRGAVYRVEYLPDGKNPPIPKAEAESEIDRVLGAPQPLEAWSMAKWMPLVAGLRTEDLLAILANDSESELRKIRAIEIVALRADRLSDRQIDWLAKSKSPVVRARLAWAIAKKHRQNGYGLRLLAQDGDPRVVVEAIARIAEFIGVAAQPDLTPAGSPTGVSVDMMANWMSHKDLRVRHAAARFVAQLPTSTFSDVAEQIVDQGGTTAMVTLLVSELIQRHSSRIPSLLELALTAQRRATSMDERIEGLRAVMLALGDWNVTDPAIEFLAAYSLKHAAAGKPGYQRMMAREMATREFTDFPIMNARFNLEASRLMAMLEIDDPKLARGVASQITAHSHPTTDFHYLAVLARLTAKPTERLTQQIASALLHLDKKLAEHKVIVESNWPTRLRELVGELLRVHPGLDQKIAGHADLLQPGNVLIAGALRGKPRIEAAARFLVAAQENGEFPLSAELVELLSTLPANDVRPLLRSRWGDRSLREAIVKQLATKPEPIDREKFLEVLSTASNETVIACMSALESLPRDESPKNLVPLLSRLRQSLTEPKESAIRKRLVELVNRQSGQKFAVEEKKETALTTSYRPIFEWFEKTHPEQAKQLATNAEDEEAIRKVLPRVKWNAGDIERGRKLFIDRGCQTCHGGNARLGPDLAGVGKRLSRDDLLTSIINPSRDVSPAYRVSTIDTKDGKRTSGIVVYDSNEMLLVQTGAAETKRIPTPDVEERSPSRKSLMPDGLLKGFKPDDLADLFAFLAKH